MRHELLTKDEQIKFCALLGENLSVLRMKASISQESLSKRLGYSRVQLGVWERGEVIMRWSVFSSFVLFFSNNRDAREIMIALGILNNDVAKILDVNFSKESYPKKEAWS